MYIWVTHDQEGATRAVHNTDDASSVTRVLAHMPHRVERVPSLDRLWQRLARGAAPDVLFLHVSGPHSRALDGLCRARRARRRQDLYVIAAIPRTDEDTVLPLAIAAGIDDWVAVPTTPHAVSLRLTLWERIHGRMWDDANAPARLRFMATHDALTGLWNRAAVFGHLYRELAQCSRQHSPLTLIMVDVDHFKAVNDTHGHATGDDVLRVVAQRLQSVVRPHDVVGRYGGEEFVVLMPGRSAAMSLEIAERARRAIAGTPISTTSGALAITVSCGIVNLMYQEHRDSLPAPQELLVAADEALYRAKRAGRNRVVVWSVAAPNTSA